MKEKKLIGRKFEKVIKKYVKRNKATIELKKVNHFHNTEEALSQRTPAGHYAAEGQYRSPLAPVYQDRYETISQGKSSQETTSQAVDSKETPCKHIQPTKKCQTINIRGNNRTRTHYTSSRNYKFGSIIPSSRKGKRNSGLGGGGVRLKVFIQNWSKKTGSGHFKFCFRGGIRVFRGTNPDSNLRTIQNSAL